MLGQARWAKVQLVHFAVNDRSVTSAEIAATTDPAGCVSVLRAGVLSGEEPGFNVEAARDHHRASGE